jgi:predicted ester cyclase
MATKTENGKTTARTPGPTTVARAYFNAISEKDLDAAAALWVPGSTDRLVGFAEFSVPAGFKQWFGVLFAAFPDFKFEILTVTAAKENAAVQWRATGTFNGTGRFEGMKPNGAKIDITGCDMMTVREGKIVDNHGYMNGTDLARQLGAAPPAGSPVEKAMVGAFNARVSAKEAYERIRNR